MQRFWKIVLLAGGLTLPLVCRAQLNVVKWTASVEPSKSASVATVDLTAKIDEGWHMYALPPTKAANIPTTIKAVAPLELAGPVTQPKTIHKFDPNFGADVDYFEKEVTFKVPVKLGPKTLSGALKVNFQACNAKSCIPPVDTLVPISANSVTSAATEAITSTAPFVSQSDLIHQEEGKGLFSFILFAFGAGLLALLTPCVFPMVPITVSYFAKRREEEGSKSGLAQAAAYCLGIIGAFTAFGLIVSALFGASGIQLFATNPWVNLAIGLLFVTLALNLFGLFEISLPHGLTNRFSSHGKGGLIAPILMGLTFTLTSFTCTVPFVGTILISAANGHFLYPIVGMLAFSSAFALPFFFLALFPQFLAGLPKSGVWLAAVKGFMGFLELAAALKFFSNADLVWSTGIFPRERFLAVWVVIGLAALAFLLGAVKLPHVQMPRRIGRARGAVILLTALAIAYIGAGIGGASLGELEAFLPPGRSGWIGDYDHALQIAKSTNKPLFVNFTGVTCTNCRWMEKNMFPRQDVVKELNNYVLVELFTDRQNESDRRNQRLQQRLAHTVALPVYLSVSPDGKVLRKFESSTRNVDEFVGFLKSGHAPLTAQRK